MHYKAKKRHGQSGWSLYVWEGKDRYVPREAWPHGLDPTWSVERAREYVKSLNASTRISAEERRRLAADERVRARRKVKHALLPVRVVEQFERIFLGPGTSRKREDVWAAAQQCVADLGVHPSDWVLAPELVYSWIASQRYSYDYGKRVVAALNRYGHLYCRLMGNAFYPLGRPTAEQRVRIDEAQEEDRSSEPLFLEHLAELSRSLHPDHWRWVQVAFWFGLRPHEVDPQHWQVEGDVLAVYQPKLRAVRAEDRWKRVPAERPEQREALRQALEEGMRRPHPRLVRGTFPPGVTLYGCRHGFAVLMDSLGVPRQTVSEWLGHRSLLTTEQYYLRLGRTVRRLKVG